MSVTYAYGYAGDRLTRDQLETQSQWQLLHPEIRERHLAMYDAARAEGVDVGLGGGGRTFAQQDALFRSRYSRCTDGTVWYDGSEWCRHTGAAAAPPGRSFHEESTPDGFAVAVDNVTGDMEWLGSNCHRWGLHDFSDVNDEPWHTQPNEFPNARSSYDSSVHVLANLVNDGPPPIPFDPVNGLYGDWIKNGRLGTYDIGDSGDGVLVAQSLLHGPMLPFLRLWSTFAEGRAADARGPKREFFETAKRQMDEALVMCTALKCDGDYGEKTAETVTYVKRAFDERRFGGRRYDFKVRSTGTGEEFTRLLRDIADKEWAA